MDAQLASIIVHDLKNSLGLLESRLLRMTDGPDGQEARHAHEACVAMRERLIGFLTLYRAQAQGLAPHADAVPIEDFIAALARRAAAAYPRIRITTTLENAPAVGFFDEHLVDLALDAAVHNASRFAKGIVQLGCAAGADGLVFSVTDDGSGLSGEPGSATTGMGMALCAVIAAAHTAGGRAGRVSLCNGTPGGARFELTLP